MGSEKTSVRGGYAIFHDSAWNQGGQGLWQNPPYYAEVDPCTFCLAYGSTFGSLSGGFLLPAGTPSTTAVAGGARLQLACESPDLHGKHSIRESQFQAGDGSAIQSEC